MDMEMREMSTNGSHGAVAAGNGGGVAHAVPDAAETDVLISTQSPGCNGERKCSNNAAESQRHRGNIYASQENSAVCRIKSELNEVVFWKVRLWMVIILVFLLIFVVIMISLVVCSAIYEDPDEKFDPSSFKVPLRFNGSFELRNLVFTEELLTLSSNRSQALTAAFEEKLADLYGASPALGRYFSEAVINGFRKGSVIADYQLTFLLPEEQQGELRNLTLSREMVYNVFRQFLYDQQPDESEPMYIDPLSLNMFLRHQ